MNRISIDKLNSFDRLSITSFGLFSNVDEHGNGRNSEADILLGGRQTVDDSAFELSLTAVTHEIVRECMRRDIWVIPNYQINQFVFCQENDSAKVRTIIFSVMQKFASGKPMRIKLRRKEKDFVKSCEEKIQPALDSLMESKEDASEILADVVSFAQSEDEYAQSAQFEVSFSTSGIEDMYFIQFCKTFVEHVEGITSGDVTPEYKNNGEVCFIRFHNHDSIIICPEFFPALLYACFSLTHSDSEVRRLVESVKIVSKRPDFEYDVPWSRQVLDNNKDWYYMQIVAGIAFDPTWEDVHARRAMIALASEAHILGGGNYSLTKP